MSKERASEGNISRLMFYIPLLSTYVLGKNLWKNKKALWLNKDANENKIFHSTMEKVLFLFRCFLEALSLGFTFLPIDLIATLVKSINLGFDAIKGKIR